MKYIITSKISGNKYLIDTEQSEIHSSLARFIEQSTDCIFTKRELKEDIDAGEIFRISTEKMK